MTIFGTQKTNAGAMNVMSIYNNTILLALLQDEQVIPDEKLRPGYEKTTGQERHRACRMKLK